MRILTAVLCLLFINCSSMIVGTYNGHPITLAEERTAKVIQKIYNTGVLSYITGDYDQAISCFESLIKRYHNFHLNYKAYNYIGLSIVAKGQIVQAIDHFKSGLDSSKYAEGYCLYKNNVSALEFDYASDSICCFEDSLFMKSIYMAKILKVGNPSVIDSAISTVKSDYPKDSIFKNNLLLYSDFLKRIGSSMGPSYTIAAGSQMIMAVFPEMNNSVVLISDKFKLDSIALRQK